MNIEAVQERSEDTLAIKEISTEIIMLMSEIIDTMGIEDELKEIKVEGENNAINQKELVKQFLVLFVTRLHRVKQPVYEFIASYKGVSIEEAKKINIIPIVKEIFGIDGVTDFL